MKTLTKKLESAYINAYVFEPVKKSNYSKPKISTGGIKISDWNKVSKKERQEALKKRWYIYYSFRNPKTGKLENQSFITGGANRYKTKDERLEVLKAYQKALELLLKDGYNPYDKTINKEVQENILYFSKALELFLKEKKKTVKGRTLIDLKNRLIKFETFLKTTFFNTHLTLSAIKKPMVMRYLRTILEKTSPRNRNNVRVDLNTFFNWLDDNEMIEKNIVSTIPVLKTKATVHKVYSNSETDRIFEYMEKNDPTLLLFVKFVSYNFLRPIEVCRITIGDIDPNNKIITFRAKNKVMKQKIIPNILWQDIPKAWLKYPKEYNLFGTENTPMIWETEENNKRDFYSKRFKKTKNTLKLDKNQTMYSFRHTHITKLYRKLRETKSPFETKSDLMLITGHSSMDALEKYLREIDAELPQDYSNLLS